MCIIPIFLHGYQFQCTVILECCVQDSSSSLVNMYTSDLMWVITNRKYVNIVSLFVAQVYCVTITISACHIRSYSGNLAWAFFIYVLSWEVDSIKWTQARVGEGSVGNFSFEEEIKSSNPMHDNFTVALNISDVLCLLTESHYVCALKWVYI